MIVMNKQTMLNVLVFDKNLEPIRPVFFTFGAKSGMKYETGGFRLFPKVIIETHSGKVGRSTGRPRNNLQMKNYKRVKDPPDDKEKK